MRQRRKDKRVLTLRNCQPRRVDLRLLRQIVQALLHATRPNGGGDLGICIVAAPEMTRLNETFLHHKGSTDVITFDYAEGAEEASRPSAGNASPDSLHGEIFICLDDAVTQARRFHVTWQSELVRYAVHGLLHLLSYDDRTARTRQRMKAAEDKLVRELAHQFDFQRLDPLK